MEEILCTVHWRHAGGSQVGVAAAVGRPRQQGGWRFGAMVVQLLHHEYILSLTLIRYVLICWMRISE